MAGNNSVMQEGHKGKQKTADVAAPSQIKWKTRDRHLRKKRMNAQNTREIRDRKREKKENMIHNYVHFLVTRIFEEAR